MKTPMQKILTITATTLQLAPRAGTPVAVGTRADQLTAGGESRVIQAQACGFELLMFIPININDRMARAYASLQTSAEGGAISNVEIQDSWGWRLIGTQYCTTLRARTVKIKAG
jgi:hypothetical protein